MAIKLDPRRWEYLQSIDLSDVTSTFGRVLCVVDLVLQLLRVLDGNWDGTVSES